MSDIPYSVRDKNIRVNAIKGFNFADIETNEMFKKVDENNVGGTDILSTQTSTINKLTMMAGSGILKVSTGVLEGITNLISRTLHINVSGVRTRGISIFDDGETARVGIGVTEPTAKLHVDGTVTAGATTVDSLTTTGTVTAGATTVDSLTTAGTVTAGIGFQLGNAWIKTSIISVGTSDVYIPNTAMRGAYLILASGTSNDDSALVAACSDDSNYGTGNVNILTRHGDYNTNYYLIITYPLNSGILIRMSNGNTRDVSVTVIKG